MQEELNVTNAVHHLLRVLVVIVVVVVLVVVIAEVVVGDMAVIAEVEMGVEVVMIVVGITTMMEAEVETMIIEAVVVEVVLMEVVKGEKIVGTVKFLLQHPILMVGIIHLLLMHMVGMQIMEWTQSLHLQAILVDLHHTLHLMVALQVAMLVRV